MDPVPILRRLVAISSENPDTDCRRIAAYVADFIRQRTAARLIRQKTPDGNVNIIAKFGRPRFFINAHLDTVPRSGNKPNAPLKLKKNGGRLYGLGTTDVKGAIACLLDALATEPPKNLMVIFSSDEEAGANSGIETFLASSLARGLEAGIVTEPTGLNIVRYHSGIANFEISFPGKAAHSADPEKGVNAIERAAEYIMKLSRYKKTLRRFRSGRMWPTLNIAIIKGGIKSNIVPDQCSLKVNFRYPPGLAPEQLLRDLKNLARDPAISVKAAYIAPPLQSNILTAAVIRRLRAAGAMTVRAGVNYWSEAALFDRAGIPAVVFGPGDIAQAHAAAEFIRCADLLKGIAVYRALFKQL
jgi:acetylornithine deacetylase